MHVPVTPRHVKPISAFRLSGMPKSLGGSGDSFQYSAGASSDGDDDTEVATLKPDSPEFVYNGLDDEDEATDPRPHSGDYSSRLDEILGETDDEPPQNGFGDTHTEDGDDDEGFFYHGELEDTSRKKSYKAQLRDVLGPDANDEEDDEPATETEDSHLQTQFNDEDDDEEFSYEEESRHLDHKDEDIGHAHNYVQYARARSPLSESTPSSPGSTPFNLSHRSTPLRPPFLHPGVSRLRSITPQRLSSYSASQQSSTGLWSPPPSHMSSPSRASSIPDLRINGKTNGKAATERNAFHWTQLRLLNDDLFRTRVTPQPNDEPYGAPTVMSANGLICIGTQNGRVLVFDFKQKLKCVCGTPSSGMSFWLPFDTQN